MLKHLLSSTAVVAILAAGPALAADQKTGEKLQQSQTMNKGSMEFVSSQSESDWLGSTLIGRTVENNNGDNLGNINNIVVNEQGQVVAVVIGVGGFLGIGEKDVGVSFATLEFKQDEAKASAYKLAGKPMNPAMNPAINPNAAKGDGADNTAAQKQASDERTKKLQADRTAAPRKDSGHSDMIIVLNTTKEQLKSAPEYKFLGETAERSDEKEPVKSDTKKQ